MKIAVIDDEKRWRDYTSMLISEHYGDASVDIDVYESGTRFLESKKIYDICFVDIEMPELDGFDTISNARKFNKEGIFIILTTHTEMCTKGYRVNAFRYIDKSRLGEIHEALESAEIILGRNEKITVNVIDVGAKELILKNIIYIETEKHYVWIHTAHSDIRCSNNMAEIEQMLENKWFYRCHTSFIVNLDEVNDVYDYYAIMNDGSKVEVSKRKLGKFRRACLHREFECANA